MRNIFFLILALFNSAFAQGREEVMLQAEVNSALITTQETTKYTITLKTTSDYKNLIIPEVGGEIAGLRIVDSGEERLKEEEGLFLSQKWYQLQGDISGSYILPAVKLEYKDLLGAHKVVETSEIFIEIKSQGEAKENEKKVEGLRDIKKIIHMGIHPLLWIFGATVGFLILSSLIYFFIFKRKSRITHEPIVPPHEWALMKIRGLQNKKNITPQELKKLYFDLSDILRNYFEAQYVFPATDRTTEEIKKELSKLECLNEEIKKEFLNILERIDIIKFTDQYPEFDFSEMSLKISENFVIKTIPEAYKEKLADTLEEDSVL